MYFTPLSTLFLLLGGAAATAIHSDEHFSTLLARQAPGTPAYECHFNCGSAITGGRVSDHCDNSTWVDYYNKCLACANEFDIWKYYGSSVGAAGAACGLNTVPSSPSSTAADAPSSSATATQAPVTVTTTSETSSAVETSVTDTATASDAPAPSTADSSATDVSATPSTSAPGASTTTAAPAAGAGSNTTASSPSASNTFVSVSGAQGTQITGSLFGVGAMVLLGLKAIW